MASIDPVAFLRSVPPFDALPAALFDEAVREVEVIYAAAGTRLASAAGPPLAELYVVRKGAVRLARDGRTLQTLEEGEAFGAATARGAALDVIVEDELVAYRLPRAAAERLLQDPRFARHFAARLADRLRASLSLAGLPPPRAELEVEVGAIATRAPVWIAPGASVGEAARIMRDARISSLLVRGEPPGILTDRDLRGRVLAAGRGPATRVAEVASSPLVTVPATTPVHAAWARLLEAGVHHLPLTREDAVVGIVTSTDLLRHGTPGPLALFRTIDQLPSRAALAGHADRVAEMCAALAASGVDPIAITGFVARLNDALVRRVLAWAEADLGPPPAPYAWLVLGSEGRMEQTLLTDQDNALVFADGAADAWYRGLAERAGEDLRTAGFPDCPGGTMASRWCAPLSAWLERFRGWLDVPTPESLLAAAVFFDLRRAGGTLDLEPLEALVASARDRAPFLRLLAEAALGHHPPPRLLLRLRGEGSRVDVKAHAITPVVFLARCYGLAAGSRARGTLERLDDAERAGLLDPEERAAVADAYRFALGLRLRRQLAARASGAPADGPVALAELGAVERTRFKEALQVIATWHGHARHQFQLQG